MLKLAKFLSAVLGKQDKRDVKVNVMGKNDTRTAFQASPFGIDSNPASEDDLVAVYADTTEDGQSVLLGYLLKGLAAEKGEVRLYSTDEDGAEQPKAYIHLKNDETLEIGGNSDNMVRFSALQTAFNQLKTEFNAHVHSSNGTPPVTPSTADISGAKIDEIKTL